MDPGLLRKLKEETQHPFVHLNICKSEWLWLNTANASIVEQ